ncbi:MAG: GntR family transcriptional regulator [Halofilum sp. (in: g-proteobacteria)]
MSERKPINAESKAQAAHRMIEEMIVTLELPPGIRISESSMSKRLGIGRTPVREALQRLARERSITILPRSGAVITDIDVGEHFKLIEARRGLERILTGRAARLAEAQARAHFRDLQKRFELAAGENSEKIFIPTDREFNRLVADTADNVYASDAMAPIQAQTRRFWYLYFKHFGDLARVSHLHAEIASAIADNAESAAVAASDRLVDYVEEYTARTQSLE